MRKVTSQIVDAFMKGKNLKVGNTKIVDATIYLHDNKIAQWREDGIWVSNAGWFSNTTKERLNGLPFVRIYQRNYTWYLNGEPWNGKWTKVCDYPRLR